MLAAGNAHVGELVMLRQLASRVVPVQTGTSSYNFGCQKTAKTDIRGPRLRGDDMVCGVS